MKQFKLAIIFAMITIISVTFADKCRCGDTLIPAKKCCKNYPGGKYKDGICYITQQDVDWNKWSDCCKKNGDGYGGSCKN